MLTWMFRGELGPAHFAPPLFPLLPAPLLLVAAGLTPAALPDLALLPLDGLRAVVSAKLRLQGHRSSSDGVALPARLGAL